MWYYNFACFIWVWNLIPHIEGWTKAESVRDVGIVESIWAKEEEGNMRLEKMAQWDQQLVLVTIHYLGDQMKEDKVSGACGMHRVEERCMQGFYGETFLEVSGIDWRITLKWILETYDGMAWTGFIWPRTGTRFMLLTEALFSLNAHHGTVVFLSDA